MCLYLWDPFSLCSRHGPWFWIFVPQPLECWADEQAHPDFFKDPLGFHLCACAIRPGARLELKLWAAGSSPVWVLGTEPLQEQQALLITEPPLQPTLTSESELMVPDRNHEVGWSSWNMPVFRGNRTCLSLTLHRESLRRLLYFTPNVVLQEGAFSSQHRVLKHVLSRDCPGN